MTDRTLVIGDVHGCLEELDELLRLIAPRAGRDRVVFVGDFLDRGPDGGGVVRRVRELGADAAMGNHEEKHLRWAKHEARRRDDPDYRNPMRPLNETSLAHHAALREDDLGFLAALPSWIPVGNGWVVVHAGFAANHPIVEQTANVMMRIRQVDAEGRYVTGAGGDPLMPRPGSVAWAERWPGPESVVYGHEPHDLENVRWDEPAPGVRCSGIDTGCCFGGHLSALVLPGCEVVRVKARAAYVRWTVGED